MANFGISTLAMVLGMAVLLVGLILLIVCVKILSRINQPREEQAKASVNEFVSAARISAVSKSIPAPIDDTLIAVLSCAVAAYIGSDRKPVIRSIRPVARQASVWAMAGRRDLM